VTLQSDLNLRALLAEIGLDHLLRWETTRTGFYVDGKLYSMSSSLDFLRFSTGVARRQGTTRRDDSAGVANQGLATPGGHPGHRLASPVVGTANVRSHLAAAPQEQAW
jgi:protoporphyrinogen oxidase